MSQKLKKVPKVLQSTKTVYNVLDTNTILKHIGKEVQKKGFKKYNTFKKVSKKFKINQFFKN